MRELCKEYSLALFELAVEENSLDIVEKDMKAVMEAIKKEPQLVDMLKTPAIPMDERLSVIDEIFASMLCEYSISFLKILCEGSRIELLSDCIKEFFAMVTAYTGKLTVRVTSALELTTEQKTALLNKLSYTYKREIDPIYRIDPSIMGGLIIETEDKIYDGSVKGSLRSVKEVMNG